MTDHDRTSLDDLTVERLLTRGEAPGEVALGDAMTQVRALAGRPAPRPNAALAELLDRGFEPTVTPLRRPTTAGRRWAARTGGAVAVAAASVLVAGTAAALPPAVQDTVADLVSALTPFELPRSSPEPGGPSAVDVPRSEVAPPEAPAPSGVPSPSEVPSAVPSGVPSAAVPSVPAPSRTASAPRAGGPTARPGTAVDGPGPRERLPAPAAPATAGADAANVPEKTGNARGQATGSAARPSPASPGPTRP